MHAGRGAVRPRRALPRRARGGVRLSGAGPPPPPPPAPPPPLRLAIAAGLHGAFLLARGRVDGLAFIEATPAGAARSFWAAAICLPGYLALRLFAWAAEGVPGGGGSGAGRAVLIELLGYACAWAGFALASHALAGAMGRSGAWPRFIAAWNWISVVQHLVMLALTLPAGIGLPSPLPEALGLAALGYALWLEWLVARTALGVAAAPAAGFVALDVVIGLFLSGLNRQLAMG